MTSDNGHSNNLRPKTSFRLEAFLDPRRSEVVQQVKRIRQGLAQASKDLPDDVKASTALGGLDKVRTGHYADDEVVRTKFNDFLRDLNVFLNTDIPLHKQSEGYDLHAQRFAELKKSFAKVIKSGTFGAHTNPDPQNLNKKSPS